MNKIITKYDEFDNLEYRKGSKQFGGLLTRLLEYLRLIRKDEKSITISVSDFENESNIKKGELVSLIDAKEKGNNLFDFSINFEGDNIIFSGFDSGKARPFESVDAIRTEYEKSGVADFYKKKGDSYKNPHFNDIEESIKIINDKNIVDFTNVLDLASGSGEVSKILSELGYENVESTDPYMSEICERNTGKKCMDYSFQDIQLGKLRNKKYSTIVCSYALHLADKSILHDLLWELSLISENFIIISPNRNPVISDDSWELVDKFVNGKNKIRIYTSKNINI